MEDKYVGLLLALSSSVLIGTSFIVTKLGLLDCTRTQGGLLFRMYGFLMMACSSMLSFERPCPAGAAGEHYNYLQNYKWWAGMITST